MAVVTSRSLSPWRSLLFTVSTKARRCSRSPSVSSAQLAVNIRRTAGQSRTNEPGHHSIALRSARACAKSRTAPSALNFARAIAVDSSEIFRSSSAREAEKSRAIRWRPARYFCSIALTLFGSSSRLGAYLNPDVTCFRHESILWVRTGPKPGTFTLFNCDTSAAVSIP